MALRIVDTEGKGYTSRIYDVATGEDITHKLHVTFIDIRMAMDRQNTATIVTYIPQLDITVEEAQIRGICPCCGHETNETIRSASDVKEP